MYADGPMLLGTAFPALGAVQAWAASELFSARQICHAALDFHLILREQCSSADPIDSMHLTEHLPCFLTALVGRLG